MQKDDSHYHCSAEWHFAQLTGKGSHFAPLLYTFAFHLSKTSGIFSASKVRLTEYFGVDDKTIRKACRLLVALGFFEIVSEEPGATVRYKLIRHKDWAAEHPGRCVQKMETPWTNEPGADPLGVQLHAISGHRFTTFPNIVKGIRKTGHGEQAICEHFRSFVAQELPKGTQWRNGFAGRFIKHLKEQPIIQ